MSEPPTKDDSDDSEGSLVKVSDEMPANDDTSKERSYFDQLLMDYVKFTSSALNTDRSLKLLQWTIWLAGYIRKSKGLQKFSIDLSFARYAIRLLGLPASMEAARTGSWGAGGSNPWVQKLGKLMAWSMVAYYPLEHVAYLRWTSPQLLPGRNAAKWSAYSCRCWLVYIVADMAQSALKLKELLSRRSELVSENQSNEEEETQAIVALNDSIRNEKLQIVRSLLFTLPAVHWSLPRWDTHPWLKESVVNGLMWAESVVSMYQSLCAYQR